MTIGEYIKQVCNKLSGIHLIMAFITFIMFGIFFGIYLTGEEDSIEERQFHIKGAIVSFIAMVYNIILFVLIPTFE